MNSKTDYDKIRHLPADGRIWFTDTRNYHTVFNGGEENRIPLVATYLGENNGIRS